jgi:hypothetical protein
MSEILTPFERKNKHVVGFMSPQTAKKIAIQLNNLIDGGVKQIQIALFFDDGTMIITDDLFKLHFEAFP